MAYRRRQRPDVDASSLATKAIRVHRDSSVYEQSSPPHSDTTASSNHQVQLINWVVERSWMKCRILSICQTRITMNLSKDSGGLWLGKLNQLLMRIMECKHVKYLEQKWVSTIT